MVNINKKYFDEALVELAWRIFLGAIKEARTEKEIKDIMGRFLTVSERLVLEKRLMALHLLRNNLSYREIGREIDISSGAIAYLKRGFKKNIKKAKNVSFVSNRRKRSGNSIFVKRIKGWAYKNNF